MAERLQKIISDAGITSRRQAEKMIQDGRISVNGKTAILGEKADSNADVICIDGKPLSIEKDKIYVMLNKPKGYVTTLSDEKGRPCVEELVRDAGRRIYPIGRLDMYSEGLLLLTDDGELANNMMHPSHEVNKVYRVTVSGNDVDSSIPELEKPMYIDGYRIKPATVMKITGNNSRAVLEITIHEGRNRQIRKMCDTAGLRVLKLQRIAEGNISLGKLETGKWRYLTQEEIQILKSH